MRGGGDVIFSCSVSNHEFLFRILGSLSDGCVYDIRGGRDGCGGLRIHDNMPSYAKGD